MICRIGYCNPIESVTALRSICMPPQYQKQASEWFGGEGTATDWPPPSPQVVVHGLMAHPVHAILTQHLIKGVSAS